MLFLAADAGVITINGTVIVELITFLIMLVILARNVYPEIVKLAEARQMAIEQQMKEAEQARVETEHRLKDAAASQVYAIKADQIATDAPTQPAQRSLRCLTQ